MEQPTTDQLSDNLVSEATKNALELLLFTQQFATAIECGTSLVRGLLALESSRPPLGPAVREVNQLVQRGETLSRAMAIQTEIFPSVYVTMVRAGERGGVLDETLRRLASLMLKEWQLRQRRSSSEPPFLLDLGQPSLPSSCPTWDQFSPYRQTVTRILFCETLGVLLSSGVPPLQSMEHTIALLPALQVERWQETRASVEGGASLFASLDQLGILSPLTMEILRLGDQGGMLDLMLLRAASLYQTELESRWP